MKKLDILVLIGVSLALLASFNVIGASDTTKSPSLTNTDNVIVPSASNVAITGITTMNGTGTYVAGMKFVIRVSFSNTGDTGVNSITAVPGYSGYAYLSSNTSASIAIPAGGTGSIEFLITVMDTAPNQNPVTITATWTGIENVTNIPVNGISTPNNLNVAIQGKANVHLTSITCGGASIAGPFVGGMTFAIRVSFKNIGGTAATGVTAAPTYGGYTGLSIAPGNFSSAITIPASGTGYIDLLIQIAEDALTNSSVDVRSTWTGIEQYSSRPLSGSSNSSTSLKVSIQRQSNVTITSISYLDGSGTYVGGMNFRVRVNFSNTGGTIANTITAGLSYGGYTSLASNSSATISVGVGGTGHIDFLISVATGASSQNPVIISAIWSGIEDISGRIISGSSSGAANLQVAIQSQAIVSITSITYRTGTGTYVGGMTFVVRVAFSNTGGTAANGITATLLYSGGYTGLFSNTSASIIIPAGGTGSIDFLITVRANATTQNPVTISAMWSGTEAISSRVLSGNSGGNNQNVAIQAQANVVITSITRQTGNGTYVGGMTFVIRINFQNTGGTAANNVFILGKNLFGISLGAFSTYNYNASNSINIAAGGTGSIDILIILDAISPSQPSVTITVNAWNATEAISNRALSGNSGSQNLVVSVQSQASVSVNNIEFWTGTLWTGTGTYVGGMTFVLRVRFYNSGGTAANSIIASLSYGGYSSLSANTSASINVAAGGNGYIYFLMTVAAGATTQNPVTITAMGSGTEAISNRALSGITGPPAQIAIQSQAGVSITEITYQTGTGTYVGGMTFVIRVSFSNTGGTLASSVSAVPSYSGYTHLSANSSALVNITAGGTNFIYFLITVSASATTAPVTINATWTGTESISNRALSGNAGTHVRLVNIQSQANVAITGITYRTGSGVYVGGMTFVIRVAFSNNGGTTANSITATPNFATYPSLSSNASSTITLTASSTGFIDLLITVDTVPIANNSVLIRSTWTGTESVSSRSLSGDSGLNNLNVAIQTRSNLTIAGLTYRTGNGTYVGGTTFVLRIAFSNTGGTAAIGITATLAYGGYSSLSGNTSASITVSASGTGSIDFLITVGVGATSQNPVTISATWTGIEAISSRALNGDSTGNNLNIAVKAQASLAITSFTWRSGNGTYIAGTSFLLRIALSNPITSAKALSVTATLNFGGASGLVANASSSRTISGTGWIDFQINITAGAPSQPAVTITATVNGTE
ncbi:MAG: beta strand repeat-containing protein, partial [Candidatus Sigynarchaeota archaeon]